MFKNRTSPWKENNGKIETKKQDDSEATLCQLIEREDGKIVWEQDAENIYNRFRAFLPWPGVYTFWKNNDSVVRIKILQMKLQKNNPGTKHSVGEVFEIGESIGVQTINGVIILKEIQLEGKEPIEIKTFLNGYKNFIGSILF